MGWLREAIFSLLDGLGDATLSRLHRIILYPGGPGDDPEERAVDIFIAWDSADPAIQQRLQAAIVHARETTDVHIAVHRLSLEYLAEIEKAATPFYQDLEQNGFQLVLE